MARFLRFIVDLFLVCAILIAAAILVPPLFGIDMTMIDSTRIKTNMPMGSVAYSRVVDASELLVGDEIIESDSSSVYSYVIKEKSGDGTFTLAASSDDNSAVEKRDLTGKVKKVAVAVPYIGYVSVAMQNLEGQIVLGLMVVLVIILFILSELWRPDEDDDSDEEEDEDEEEGKTAVLDAAEDELAAAGDGEAGR